MPYAHRVALQNTSGPFLHRGRRQALIVALLFGLGMLVPAAATGTVCLLTNADWSVELDPATGGLVRVENRHDPLRFNWLREAGRWERQKWVSDSSPDALTHGIQWGLVETPQTGLLHAARLRKVSDTAWEAEYMSPSLTVTVRRELDSSGGLCEQYTFQNTGLIALELPVGALAISAPLFDQYPDAARSLSSRCHVHLWMGGRSAWINAMRMGTAPPHLGLVLTQGSLDAYSQRGGTFSDRGTFLLHPARMKLLRGESQTLAWRIFWHTGWDDFFSQALSQPGFVRLSARRYTVVAGQALEFEAKSAKPLEDALVLANGRRVQAQGQGTSLCAAIPTSTPGELTVELVNGRDHSRLRANVVPDPDTLIAQRARFVVRNQQRRAEGDPLDGAYLAFDNSTSQQVYGSHPADHNAGRERLGMGVLVALYLSQCQDEALRAELKASLDRYAAFVARELEDDAGTVYGSVGRQESSRRYNYPWAAHFHLAMFQATGDPSQLDRFVRVCRKFYAVGGDKFYAIGLPVTDALQTLAKAGRETERAELLAKFRAHADYFLKVGTNYPRSEVNYEQSIVGPAVQLLLEVYLATGERAYLEGAKQQMPLLEAFSGRQPDYRLNEVAIRHWDDYWFGRLHQYGDTFPHYWSTISGLAFAFYGKATGQAGWAERADAVLKANLALFGPDGHASAAYLYPLTCDGRPTATNDPWANDQDWALVNLLMVRELLNH
jgi:hypothetical protein